MGRLAPSHRRPLVHASVPAWGYGLRISCSPFSPGRQFLLPSCVRRPGLLVVIAMQPLFLIFSIQLAGLFEHPTFSVGVVGWFIGGAVNLTRAIKYAVQTGRARIASFERLFPLTGLEPLNPTLTDASSAASLLFQHLFLLRRGLPLPSLASEVSGSLVLLLLRANQLSSPAQKRVISAVRAAMVFGFS